MQIIDEAIKTRGFQAMVEMRDGTRLNTFVFLPGSGGPRWPVILHRTPYGITTANTRDKTGNAGNCCVFCSCGTVPCPSKISRVRVVSSGLGITNYNPLHKNRRKGLQELRTGDEHPVPAHLKAEILREIDRLELVLRQINEVEAERDEMLRLAQASSPVALLMPLLNP